MVAASRSNGPFAPDLAYIMDHGEIVHHDTAALPIINPRAA
jgi:hypothetical protein